METSRELTVEDVERQARAESPELAQAVLAFLAQPDKAPDKPLPQGALDFQRLMALLHQARSLHRAEQRRAASREAWQRFLAQKDVPLPPRFALADLLVSLYQHPSHAARAALLELARTAPLRFGLWAGLKRLYKLAEQRHDAELFGVLAWRFDTEPASHRTREVSTGTLTYLRRRAWRYLRQLGQAVPELYPQFAVEVLRHYEPDTSWRACWVAHHVWAHGLGTYSAAAFPIEPPADMVKKRAYTEAWRRSADPLLRLLDTCESDPAVRFAIQGLRQDFPQALRHPTPEWLARLARRPLASAHEFLVETLQGSAELHPSKLRALGLHEPALALLRSPSAKARAWAIEYARAHAQDMAAEQLAELVERGANEVRSFAAAVLEKRPPRELGPALLGRLLLSKATSTFAARALEQGFDRAELSQAFLFDLLYGQPAQFKWARDYLKARYAAGELGPEYWKALLDDPRREAPEQDTEEVAALALHNLGTFPLAALGAEWLLNKLLSADEDDQVHDTLLGWLNRAESLPGLDVERVKSFVFNARQRAAALALLGNRKLFTPRQIGIAWLLALARRADPALHDFAHRYLLEHVAPEDFDESGSAAAGLERLFELALGARQPAPARAFAQTYLRCHHPVLGREQPESKSYELKPRAPREAYTPERLWPALADAREDVRRFALALARVELRAWGWQGRVYELAESEYKEIRNLAYDSLLHAGESGADKRHTLTLDELDPVKVFTLTESTKRSTREVAVELIRRHYARLGGPERLGWLMESADREVGLFAVRLLWERHRPLHLPEGWKPAKAPKEGPPPGDTERFEDVEALRSFMRRLLFGLPPGRAKESREGNMARRLSASAAKRRVVELVRDLGLEDEAFARVVAPVLKEFTGSMAKGEWQSCLASLVQLRAAHPGAELAL